MKNKKGFTLIELLAVIVILGVILTIAIPKVSQYITNSRKNSFISSGKLFIDSVREDATSEMYPLPVSNNDVVIITIDKIDMEKSKKHSPFGGDYVYNKSYVAIINVGDGSYPEYMYYYAAQDSKGYAIPLTAEEELTKEKVVANAKNKMEVTIQSICGSDQGTSTVYGSLSGLPTGHNWNAIVYSTDACAKSN